VHNIEPQYRNTCLRGRIDFILNRLDPGWMERMLHRFAPEKIYFRPQFKRST
jgi:hypothetical protein